MEKIIIPAVIAVLAIILILTIVVSLKSSKGNSGKRIKNVKTTGCVLGYEDDPNNLSVKYPRISFYDEDLEQDAEGVANAVKFNKLPPKGCEVNITYTRKKYLGQYQYIVKII